MKNTRSLRWLGFGAVAGVGLGAFACGSSGDVFQTRDTDAGAAGGSTTGNGGASGSGAASNAGACTPGAGNCGGSGASGGAGNGGGSGVGGASASGGATASDSGTGGASGADAGCLDQDKDGQTTCQGDCDDNDPNDFTGNVEFCGDAKDNNCNSQAEEGCGGIGTYVSGTVGKAGNPGTQALPVLTIAAGLANARTIGGGVPVFVAQGHYPEKVTLVEGIDMLGGHQCDTTTCTWARDPVTYDTAILSQDAEGVLAGDSITRATMIDGFRIMGQNGATTGRGRASVTLRGGSPTISNDRIFGPDVNGGGGVAGRSIGVLILSATNGSQGALIESNTITGGTASDQSDAILMEAASFPSPGPTIAVIRKNTITGGTGTSSNAIAAWTAGAGTRVENNDIATGSATSSSAWAISVGSQMVIDGNRINVGNQKTACQPGNQTACGGINSLSSTTTITNNVVFGVVAPRSYGVHLMEAEVPGGVVILNGNYIDGGGTPSSSGSGRSMSAAVVVEIGPCNTCGFNGKIGRIRNNVLAGGVGSDRYSVYEQAPNGKTQHPEALTNNDLWINNLAGNDALYRRFDGTNGTNVTTFAAVNGLGAVIAGLVVGANFASDPNVNATFHLNAGSPCIDTGTSTEAPATDMDGDARPKGIAVDVGADER